MYDNPLNAISGAALEMAEQRVADLASTGVRFYRDQPGAPPQRQGDSGEDSVAVAIANLCQAGCRVERHPTSSRWGAAAEPLALYHCVTGPKTGRLDVCLPQRQVCLSLQTTRRSLCGSQPARIDLSIRSRAGSWSNQTTCASGGDWSKPSWSRWVAGLKRSKRACWRGFSMVVCGSRPRKPGLIWANSSGPRPPPVQARLYQALILRGSTPVAALPPDLTVVPEKEVVYVGGVPVKRRV